MSNTEYKRKIDSLLAQAEHSLHQTQGSPLALNSTGAALTSVNPNQVSHYRGGVAGAQPQLYHRDPYVLPSSPVSGAEGAWTAREEEFGRQLRLCMKEIGELRNELALEREGRHQVQSLLAKRAKEEVMVEVHSVQNQVRHDMRELEANMQQRLSDGETTRAVDRRKVEDAIRMLKSQERTQFDVAEQYRDQLDDMRQRVDSCVSASTTIRTEVTHQIEAEKGRMEHRLDVELERYAEMHRQHQQGLSETQRSVAREVQEVGKTVTSMVDRAWDDRIKVVQKSLSESLGKYQRVQEQQSDLVSNLSGQVTNYLRESKRDLTQSTAELRDRLAILEANAPMLSAQMDRVQRKADTAVESNSNMSAMVDVLREAADKATAQAHRSCERAQKVEDTLTDRDNRLLALESQAVALAGFDRLRNDLDATKRAVQRVEGSMDTVRQVADRSERLVEDMQRSVDAAADRGDSIEKKASRAIAKLETTETRISSLADTARRAEESTEKLKSDAEAAEQLRESLRTKLETVDHRLSTHAEGVRGSLVELSQQVRAFELRLTTAEELSQKEQHAALNQRMDRIERRHQKTEASGSNVAENMGQLREGVDSCRELCDALSKKVESGLHNANRQLETAEKRMKEHGNAISGIESTVRSLRSSSSAAEDNMGRVSGSLGDQVQELNRRVGRLVADSQHGASAASGGGAGGRELAETQAHVDHLTTDFSELRRRCDATDRRVHAVELRQQRQQEDLARVAQDQQVVGQRLIAEPVSSVAAQPVAQITPQYDKKPPPAAAAQPLFADGARAKDSAAAIATTVVATDNSGLESGWGGGTSQFPSPGQDSKVSDSTSMVSSVHMQKPAPKPSEMNFDETEEEGESTVVSAVATTAKPQRQREEQEQPPPPATAPATKPPAMSESALGTAGTEGDTAATRLSRLAGSPPSPTAQAQIQAMTMEGRHSKPLAKTAYSSSEDSTPPRSYSGAGAPVLPKQSKPLTTENPFDKDSESEQSFELAQSIPRDSELPDVTADAQPAATRGPQRHSLSSLSASATPPLAPATTTPRTSQLPVATATAAAVPAPAKAKKGGMLSSSEDDILLPPHRSAKHYVSTTGESSEGASPDAGIGTGAGGTATATTEETRGKQFHAKKSAAVGSKNYNEFDDESSSDEEDEDGVFEVSSRHSRTSSRGSRSGSRSQQSRKTTGSATGSHVTDISLTITPLSKTGTKRTATAPKTHDFDDDDNGDEEPEPLGDDELAAMF